MRIVIAPDKFKGCLCADEVADAIAAGIRRAMPKARIETCPLADGGEGTVRAMVAASGGEIRTSRVHGPLPKMHVTAHWGLIDGGRTAVIEMAEAAGLWRVPTSRKNPLTTTTFGVGQLLMAAARAGATRAILGIGGSATNDGGLGALQAIGAEILLSDGLRLTRRSRPLVGGDVAHVVELTPPPPLPFERIDVACDVRNPLCGPQGASAIYGPQKGATRAMVKHLDRSLARLAILTGTEEAAGTPGAGASGGLGYGLIAFLPQTHLVPGFELIAGAAKLAERLKGCTLCFTGEGALDNSSASGKTVAGVARLCRQAGVPCVALTGAVRGDLSALYANGLTAAFAIADGPMTLEESHTQAKQLLARAAEAVVRIYSSPQHSPASGRRKSAG